MRNKIAKTVYQELENGRPRKEMNLYPENAVIGDLEARFFEWLGVMLDYNFLDHL